MSKPAKAIAKELQLQIMTLGGFLLVFWGLEISDQFILRPLFRVSLDGFGLVPRNLIGLRGIIFAPFLHGDFGHLIANTPAFAFLGWLVMLRDAEDFWVVTLITSIIGGLGVWLIAATGSIHIGASILIFGYLGFLLFRGYFQRDIPSIAIAALAFFSYGSVLWGILPTTAGVSWEGHLFGFIGGAIAAKILVEDKRAAKKEAERKRINQ